MTPNQVRKYYGTPTRFASATGYTRVVLYQWVNLGYVPERAQMVLTHKTNGLLSIGPPYGSKKK